jgi:predicted  nucleic acid-binding Zn-ribbon protein
MFRFCRKRTNYKALYEEEQKTTVNLRKLMSDQQDDIEKLAKERNALQEKHDQVMDDFQTLAVETQVNEQKFKAFVLVVMEMADVCGRIIDEFPRGMET